MKENRKYNFKSKYSAPTELKEIPKNKISKQKSITTEEKFDKDLVVIKKKEYLQDTIIEEDKDEETHEMRK